MTLLHHRHIVLQVQERVPIKQHWLAVVLVEKSKESQKIVLIMGSNEVYCYNCYVVKYLFFKKIVARWHCGSTLGITTQHGIG